MTSTETCDPIFQLVLRARVSTGDMGQKDREGVYQVGMGAKRESLLKIILSLVNNQIIKKKDIW